MQWLCYVGAASGIKHDIMLVNGAPQVELLTVDFDNDFIEMSLIAWLWPLFANFSSAALGKL